MTAQGPCSRCLLHLHGASSRSISYARYLLYNINGDCINSPFVDVRHGTVSIFSKIGLKLYSAFQLSASDCLLSMEVPDGEFIIAKKEISYRLFDNSRATSVLYDLKETTAGRSRMVACVSRADGQTYASLRFPDNRIPGVAEIYFLLQMPHDLHSASVLFVGVLLGGLLAPQRITPNAFPLFPYYHWYLFGECSFALLDLHPSWRYKLKDTKVNRDILSMSLEGERDGTLIARGIRTVNEVQGTLFKATNVLLVDEVTPVVDTCDELIGHVDLGRHVLTDANSAVLYRMKCGREAVPGVVCQVTDVSNPTRFSIAKFRGRALDVLFHVTVPTVQKALILTYAFKLAFRTLRAETPVVDLR